MKQTVYMTKRTAGWFVALVIVVQLAIGWVGDKRSCLRQDGARDGIRLVAETAARARRADAMKKATTPAERDNFLRIAVAYDKAAADARQLSCKKPVPQT